MFYKQEEIMLKATQSGCQITHRRLLII